MITLTVMRGYVLSRLIVRRRLTFWKTCGGLKVEASICFDVKVFVRFASALATCERRAHTPAAFATEQRESLTILAESRPLANPQWRNGSEMVSAVSLNYDQCVSLVLQGTCPVEPSEALGPLCQAPMT
jgi:hypothetical protein